MSIQTTSLDKFNNNFWLNTQKEPVYNAPSLPNDSVSFTSGLNENLKINKEKSIAGTVFEGKLNDKHSSMKVIVDEETTYYEGKIGNKDLNLKCSDNYYEGEYGNEKINISIDYEKPSKINKFFNQTILGKSYRPDYFNIHGTIGDQEIDLKLPNEDIPLDENKRDMLAIILFDNGLQARTYKGKIVTLYYSGLEKARIRLQKQQRDKMIDDNIKPLISQGISTALGIVIGSLSTALMGKVMRKK